MKANLTCINCMLGKAEQNYLNYDQSEDGLLHFMKEVYGEISVAHESDTAPLLYSKINAILENKFDIGDPFYRQKRHYNQFLMLKEMEIVKRIQESDDQLMSALQFAMIGNLIDFGAMDTVDEEKLESLIERAGDQNLDAQTVKDFRQELELGHKLVYLTDNAGEIVFDKILIQTIQQLYPEVNIQVIVRGDVALNDALMEDAEEVGLTKIVPVMGNGTKIPGTQLGVISQEAQEAIDSADFILSKGQGNFESLSETGRNIYFLFLCKCQLFIDRFQTKQFQGIFIKE
ncbi:ARMT1-like domain-containing protein [Gottschalkiaceae bacterium SANA]|nr:ARMT1-like domain-containing protein [Gottschalkiaceae bacterium SANA]